MSILSFIIIVNCIHTAMCKYNHAAVGVAVSVLVTVVLMCLRESNKKATDDLDKDELLLEEIESLDQIGDT